MDLQSDAAGFLTLSIGQRPPAAPAADMSDADKAFATEVTGWVRRNQANSTRRSHALWFGQWTAFANAHGTSPLPASAPAVARFIMFSATEERTAAGYAKPLARSTITHGLMAAIASEHKLAGLPSPTADPLVKAALRTAQKVAPKGRGQKLPLQHSHIDAIAQMLAAPDGTPDPEG
jgi:hypothetical protein